MRKRPFAAWVAGLLTLGGCGSSTHPPPPGAECTGTSCASAMDGGVDSGVSELGGGDSGPVLGSCDGGPCVASCESLPANTSLGCDFVVATPALLEVATGDCLAVFVANNGTSPILLSLSSGAQSLDAASVARIPTGPDATSWPQVPAAGLPAGQVAVVFLSGDACPVAAVSGSTSSVTNTTGQAFRLTTSAPANVYDIYPFGGATTFVPGATLLYPSTSWGTNYVVATPRRESVYGGPQSPTNTRWIQIVGATDGTTVSLVPTTDLVGAPANTVTTFTLDAGEYRQFAADGEMSGSVISSDHPVALNSGNWAFNLVSKTSPSGYVDECHQQIPPVTALGYEYVAAPYTTRLSTLAPESVPYRFVGVVNGTTLSYDPPIAGAPPTLNLGDVADFETTSPFDVKSDATHPFYVAQFMPGCVFTVPSRPDYPGSTDPMLGDPEFVNVLPAKQFLSSYVFYTDVTFRTTNLVLTRRVGSGAVTVDCLGAVTSFTAVGTSGFEIANVDLVRAGVNVGACANGPHTASSADPFGLVVWGTDTAASYAYPAGGSVAALTTVVVPATTQ